MTDNNDNDFGTSVLKLVCNLLHCLTGSDGRGWPWGFEDPDASRMPAFSQARTMPPPDNVDAHPAGASWAGVQDLVGNIYQVKKISAKAKIQFR